MITITIIIINIIITIINIIVSVDIDKDNGYRPVTIYTKFVTKCDRTELSKGSYGRGKS